MSADNPLTNIRKAFTLLHGTYNLYQRGTRTSKYEVLTMLNEAEEYVKIAKHIIKSEIDSSEPR